jgi:siroheme synthase-like protein
MYLPLAFKGTGMRCLIIGGGDVACRKLEFLSAADCEVTLVAPRVNNEIQSAIATKCVRWIAREYAPGDCRGYQLVIAATERRETNQTIFEEAVSLCIPINVVDDPDLCTVIFPAVWRQGPLTISVNTEGVAPFMAAAIRDRLSVQCSSFPVWVETAAKFRAAVRSEVSNWREKNLLYRQFAEAIRSENPPNPPDSAKLCDWIAWLGKIRKDRPGE